MCCGSIRVKKRECELKAGGLLTSLTVAEENKYWKEDGEIDENQGVDFN